MAGMMNGNTEKVKLVLKIAGYILAGGVAYGTLKSDVNTLKDNATETRKRVEALELQNAEKQKDIEYIKKGIDEIKDALKEKHK